MCNEEILKHMYEDMTFRGLAERTKESYIFRVKKYMDFHKGKDIVNVNRKMYKFLNLFMYKIMHKKFHVLSESNSNLSFNRYEFPVIFII